MAWGVECLRGCGRCMWPFPGWFPLLSFMRVPGEPCFWQCASCQTIRHNQLQQFKHNHPSILPYKFQIHNSLCQINYPPCCSATTAPETPLTWQWLGEGQPSPGAMFSMARHMPMPVRGCVAAKEGRTGWHGRSQCAGSPSPARLGACMLGLVPSVHLHASAPAPSLA